MKREAIRGLVARNIRKEAETRGVAINTLADSAGVSRSQMYAVLSSETGMTLDWLDKIADALKVHPSVLLAPSKKKRRRAG